MPDFLAAQTALVAPVDYPETPAAWSSESLELLGEVERRTWSEAAGSRCAARGGMLHPVRQKRPGDQLMDQPFDGQGRLLCASCSGLIDHFYVLVNEHDGGDYDPQVAVHVGCQHQLAGGARAFLVQPTTEPAWLRVLFLVLAIAYTLLLIATLITAAATGRWHEMFLVVEANAAAAVVPAAVIGFIAWRT